MGKAQNKKRAHDDDDDDEGEYDDFDIVLGDSSDDREEGEKREEENDSSDIDAILNPEKERHGSNLDMEFASDRVAADAEKRMMANELRRQKSERLEKQQSLIAEAPEEANCFHIKFVEPLTNTADTVKMLSGNEWKVVVENYCKAKNWNPKDMIFSLDALPVDGNKTVTQNDLGDGDVVEISFRKGVEEEVRKKKIENALDLEKDAEVEEEEEESERAAVLTITVRNGRDRRELIVAAEAPASQLVAKYKELVPEHKNVSFVIKDPDGEIVEGDVAIGSKLEDDDLVDLMEM
jgi:hypothetical protein